QDCFVCGQSGATITCRESGCNRSFHLPCAVAGECITQYFTLYSNFSLPKQEVVETPEEDTTCLICLEPVEHRLSYGTIMCPACNHAWFHRSCIQKHAIHAGFHCLSC
ncbi:G2E3 ligase, partial [Zapornia atra]|nr:G2E3 ligase [Zapornia atra]